MIYTEAQKEIIRGIANREYTNIWEYILSITPEEDKKIEHKASTEHGFNWHIYFYNENLEKRVFNFIRITSNTEGKLLDFTKVCLDLRSHNLVFSTSPYGHVILNLGCGLSHLLISDEENTIIRRISQFLYSNLSSELSVETGFIKKEYYYPVPALQEFIDNKYKTAEELKLEEQTKYLDHQLLLQKEHHNDQLQIQNTSLNWTKGIAITGIILSLITICLTIYNNSQPSDRNVTLKNPTDTIRVINITPSRVIPKDSVRLDSTNNK